MYCKQNRTKTNKTKTAATQTHSKTTEENKTKIPPSTHAYTYTFRNKSMVVKATSNTTYLNTSLRAWREGEQSSEITALKMTHHFSGTILLGVI